MRAHRLALSLAGALVLSAASDFQTAGEGTDAEQHPHGLFSLALLDVLSRAPADQPVDRLFASVRALMQRLPRLQSLELQPPGGELAGQLADHVRALQEPQASAASFAHWHLMRAVRAQGVKVVLNGQGADELLAGYGPRAAADRAGLDLEREIIDRDSAAVLHGQATHAQSLHCDLLQA